MVNRHLQRLGRWAGRAFVYRAPQEHQRCPACNSEDLGALAVHKLPSAVDGRRTGLISGCEECGFVFVNPIPADDVLAAMYGPDGVWASFRADERPTKEPECAPAPGSGSWPRMFDAIRHDLDVTRPPSGSRVLDFGCGRGKFLNVLQPCGWETFGIEPATEVAFSRHHRLTAVPADPVFDLVIAHHVLEHVTNPLLLLRRFASATKMGGYLLVGVPRLDTLPRHRDYGYVINRVHVAAYTAACVKSLLARAGWQLVEEPSDDVSISRGRHTSARLRVLARRVAGDIARPERPLRSARVALAVYQKENARLTRLERLGAIRLAARIGESRRRLRKWARRFQTVTQHAAR